MSDPFVLMMTGLPDPMPPIGPPESVLQDWYNLLISSNEELTTTANRALAAAVTPEAWYGASADNFRQEATADGLALLGVAQGMSEVAGALITYLSAAEQWDRDLAAAKAKDQDGIHQEERVSGLCYQYGTELAQKGKLYGASSYYCSDPRVWAKVAAVAGQTTPPQDIRDYVSPIKKQARLDFDNAENTLALAGRLAASKIMTVVDEATTVVDRDGTTGHTSDPLVGLRELGTTVLNGGGDPLPTGDAGLTPKEIQLEHEEDGDYPGQQIIEPGLALNDIRSGALKLAGIFFGDDGTEGVTASQVAGEDAAGSLVSGSLSDTYGDSEGDELSGAGDDDPLIVTRIGKTGIGVLGLASDISTITGTEDTGVHGAVTRASASLNAAATGADVLDGVTGGALATEEIPGVDIVSSVVLVGTGLYAIGNAIFDHGHPAHVELP